MIVPAAYRPDTVSSRNAVEETATSDSPATAAVQVRFRCQPVIACTQTANASRTTAPSG
jgi:hypothetical protein